MFNRFKREKPTGTTSSVELSVVELCADGYCAVVGESHYQDALRATSRVAQIGAEGRRVFTAVLVPEPENPYDANAVAIYSTQGKIGHLSRDDALAYRDVLAEVTRRGHHGGSCLAYLNGGEPGKPSFGVSLQLADAHECLAELSDE